MNLLQGPREQFVWKKKRKQGKKPTNKTKTQQIGRFWGEERRGEGRKARSFSRALCVSRDA